MSQKYIAPASQLPVGTVAAFDGMAVGNNGAHFAVSRRCRHLGGDLGEGSIDSDGCLVCPWHGAAFKLLTWAVPLRRGRVVEREGELYLKRPYCAAVITSTVKRPRCGAASS